MTDTLVEQPAQAAVAPSASDVADTAALAAPESAAAAASTIVTGTDAAPQAKPTTETVADDDQSIKLSEAKKLRSEAQSLRDRIAAIESDTVTKLAEAEERGKASANTETAKLRNELKSERINSRLEAALRAEGVSDIDLAKRTIDLSGVEIDDNGSPKGLTEKIAEALAAHPILRGTSQTSASAGSPANPSRSGHQTITKETLRSMNALEVLENWDAISEVMKQRGGKL